MITGHPPYNDLECFKYRSLTPLLIGEFRIGIYEGSQYDEFACISTSVPTLGPPNA